MSRFRQHGASGLMIAVVLILFAVVLLALRVLSRMGDMAQDKNDTLASLQRAQAALDQYVAAGGANARLPCPADPSIDETASPANALMGVEQPQSTKDCKFAAGTLPWRTIGLRRDDAYDAWGRKLAYRVYTSTSGKGSLVQAGGPSLTNCYSDTTAGGGTDSNGFCNTDHTTSSFDVLKKKQGLDVTDFGTQHSSTNDDPAAYVVISHGPTGLGGYTSAGVQLDTPGSNDEKNNLKDTGPFTLEAWSDPDTGSTDSAHFDDLLVYRTAADLAQKTGLQARAWGVASLTFDNATVAAALGQVSVTAGDTGSKQIAFGTTTVRGFTGTNTATDISYDDSNGHSALGVVSGGSNLISSTANEMLRFDFGASAKQFAVTLNDFGELSTPFGPIIEQVQLKFYNGGSLVSTVQKGACSTDSTVLSTLSVNVGVDFNRVEVRPQTATFLGFPVSDSSFSVAAVSACRSGVTCTTAIASSGVSCP
jgi:hypothetical protein